MTREEAIQNINALNSVCGQKDFYDKGFEEALNMAIKAIEKDSVLDKIRAELASAEEKWWYGVDNDCFMKLSDVLQIIDKYTAEGR